MPLLGVCVNVMFPKPVIQFSSSKIYDCVFILYIRKKSITFIILYIYMICNFICFSRYLSITKCACGRRCKKQFINHCKRVFSVNRDYFLCNCIQQYFIDCIYVLSTYIIYIARVYYNPCIQMYLIYL